MTSLFMQHTLDLKEFQLLSVAAVYITGMSAITLCSISGRVIERGELISNTLGYFFGRIVCKLRSEF